MTESITSKVLAALADTGLLTSEQVASVTEAGSTGGLGVGDMLVQRGLVSMLDLESVLESELGIPRVELSSYAPDEEALQLVPAKLAFTYKILPLFEIEGMLTVAVGEAVDVFQLDEISSVLGLEVEAVLADPVSVSTAIELNYGVSAHSLPELEVPVIIDRSAEETFDDPMSEFDSVIDVADFFDAAAPEVSQMPADESSMVVQAPDPIVEAAPTIEEVVQAEIPTGSKAIDLDVLAVADPAKVAVLVSDILANAVSRGANRIHLLPYKEDFFLVYRIAGKLEKIASAPLSLQGALVDGIKSYAKLTSVQASRPALGRVKAHLGDRDMIITVSAVPTIAGQRMVVSLSSGRSQPRGLSELGMNEAETRALHAMVERGRGILLVCAPVAGGRSSTYYALLQHAAQVGKTVYSVERSIEYEIPSVAQVLVNPGAPVGAAAYFAAGMRQDTDVMAIDPMQSVEDIHLAVEAAALGKLVIASFSGGDIVSGVRRMLDLGAEPVSLASALTLGVGQRLVRLNCPHCTGPVAAGSSDILPGLPTDATLMKGAGCPACAGSGFQSMTGIFEVLPFTEQVRVPIARGATAEDISLAARAAGMRSMLASGVARVAEGRVSPEEFDRVLRFSQPSS
ncbi:MAG: Flp pilus assembly complex ATPase component TadA [Actinobacteria bacterium]|nr:Flp pilus assembly complex ATPase component TadA [Actinomycetota bacterium]MCL5887045.1 Flp pilus assembly complex ATPase component TadA [Actinomycetota bacterium]